MNNFAGTATLGCDAAYFISMERIFYPFILTLAFALAVSCEEIVNNDYIVDWAPVELTVTATDNAGQSIISPDMPGMSLSFKGDTYTVKSSEDVIATKAYLAIIKGLIAVPDEADSLSYHLYFGEIDGAEDMDEDIVLNWPDGSTDTINYKCWNHRGGRHISCKREWKLNGEKFGSGRFPVFSFTGKSLAGSKN